MLLSVRHSQPYRWGVGRSGEITAWIAGNAVCGALIALPDEDHRLFSISDLHGPSPIDALGAIGLVLLWVPVLAATVRAVRRQAASVRLGIAIVAAVLLAALLVTVLGDFGWWWVPPALGLGALQLAVLWPSRDPVDA